MRSSVFSGFAAPLRWRFSCLLKTMMHYYMHDGPAAFRFELAGELDAHDAARLEQVWRTASSTVGNRTLLVDMSFVTGIDDTVRHLFQRWHEAGAEFAPNSGQARELVESITGRPFTPQLAHPPEYRSWIPVKLRPFAALLALLVFFTPSQARGADDDASLAFARFVTHSGPAYQPAGGDMVVEIDASLPQMDKQGEVTLIRHREPARAAEYQVLQSCGDSIVRQQVIARYLTIEQQAYELPASVSAVTPENYKFRYMAEILDGGNHFYVYGIKPRRRSEGLMQGQIWIDAKTGAVVHQEGRLAKRGSVFIRKIEMIRDAGARVDSPYVRVTRVDIDTRWFGHAELTIRERPALSVSSAEGVQ